MSNATPCAPRIETERTIMRAHRLADFDAYAAMSADPQVTRFIGGKPRTREESWLRFLRHPGVWTWLGFGYWAIEDRQSGAFIGEAGFHDMRRDMTPPIEGLPEAGWSLVPAAQGRGLATEVVRAMLDWSDHALDFDRTVCIINVDNEASIRLARRCGYGAPSTGIYHGEPLLLMERAKALPT